MHSALFGRFLLRGQHTKCMFEAKMRSFFAMCERFGVPVADDKTIVPVRSIEYLGLVINSTSFDVQVPVENMRTLQADIAKIIGCEKV